MMGLSKFVRGRPSLMGFFIAGLPEIPSVVRLEAATFRTVANLGIFVGAIKDVNGKGRERRLTPNHERRRE